MAALTPYSPFFLSGLIFDHPDTSYLDFAESQSLRSYPSLKRKPSSLRSELQPPRLRQRSSECSLPSVPSQKPEPMSPLPPCPLATATNLLGRTSTVSTVASSYKRRKRTDALAALEGRRPLSDLNKNFISLSDDEDEEEEYGDNAEAAEFYGSLVSDAHTTGTGLSSFSFGFADPPALPVNLTSTLDLSEDIVLPPPSPMGQMASKPVIPPPVPKLSPPVKGKKTRQPPPPVSHTSFFPHSPTSYTSLSTGPFLTMDNLTPMTSRSALLPLTSTAGWNAVTVESPFLPPFTFEDIDINLDFSTPPRAAPSPEAYSPPLRPARRSEDDLPVQSELALRQIEAAARAAMASPNKPSPLTRTGSRTRTISSPSRTSSKRTKKGGRQALNAMSSFIEFDLGTSIASKPSHQDLRRSYWNWKDAASTTTSSS